MKLHYSFQTPDKLYLVMDFINGGELFYHLQSERRFSPERSRFYAAEIVLGLEHLHKNGIIYRDLKPENLLLDASGHVKMTDFGLSKEGLTNEDRTNTFCGTPEYLAPEVLDGKDYNKAVDWWSLGTLIYEMLTGLPPFYDEDVQKMYNLKMTAELTIPDYVDDKAKDIMRKFFFGSQSKYPYARCRCNQGTPVLQRAGLGQNVSQRNPSSIHSFRFFQGQHQDDRSKLRQHGCQTGDKTWRGYARRPI
jgi:serine/threonine protein kinase